MKLQNRLGIIVCLASTALVACGRRQLLDNLNDSAGLDTVETSVESGVTAISAVADDQAGSNLASGQLLRTQDYVAKIWQQLVPQAWADSCSRPIFELCIPTVSGSERSAVYASCPLARGASLSGWAKLTYTDANCQVDVGDQVNRTFDLNISGVYGGQLSISSQSQTDYRGITYGGGGLLERLTANAWSLAVLGKRKVLTYAGKTRFDVSVRTTSPVGLYNTLSRSGRVIDGGQFEVNHNRAKFTATYVPQNLAYSGSCCHPISGKLLVNYAGSVTGSAEVEFNGCGSATLTKDGLSRSVDLNYCE